MTDRSEGEHLRETAATPAGDASHDLVAGAAAGDERSIDGLLAMHLPELRAYVRLHAGGVIRARETSGDIVQSVCREVLEDLGAGGFEYRGEAEFRNWLYTTTRRKLVDKHRFYTRDRRDIGRERGTGRGGDESIGDELAAVYGSLCPPSRHAVVREELEAVERAFDRLPESYREVITMARIRGLGHREIAEATGRTEVATRQLLVRALARLSSLLAAERN